MRHTEATLNKSNSHKRVVSLTVFWKVSFYFLLDSNKFENVKAHLVCWVTISEDDILKYCFLIFPQNIDFDISCKLSSWET